MFDDDNVQNDSWEGEGVFTEKIVAHQDQKIDHDLQKRLNKPTKKSIKPKYKDYLKLILDLLEKKEIEAFVPGTFINQDIYDALDEKAQAEVDKTLLNLASMVQQLQYLSDNGAQNSFQLESLVDNIWYTKERIEEVHGDVYKV